MPYYIFNPIPIPHYHSVAVAEQGRRAERRPRGVQLGEEQSHRRPARGAIVCRRPGPTRPDLMWRSGPPRFYIPRSIYLVVLNVFDAAA